MIIYKKLSKSKIREYCISHPFLYPAHLEEMLLIKEDRAKKRFNEYKKITGYRKHNYIPSCDYFFFLFGESLYKNKEIYIFDD